MKKFLVLLSVLGLLATPAMAAGTQLEKGPAHHKQTAKRHETKRQKKQANKRQKKTEKKLVKHNAKKHKVAV